MIIIDGCLNIDNKERIGEFVQKLNSSSFSQHNKNVEIVDTLLKSVLGYFSKQRPHFDGDEFVMDNWIRQFAVDFSGPFEGVEFANKQVEFDENGFEFDSFVGLSNLSVNESQGEGKKRTDFSESCSVRNNGSISDLLSEKNKGRGNGFV